MESGRRSKKKHIKLVYEKKVKTKATIAISLDNRAQKDVPVISVNMTIYFNVCSASPAVS